MPKTPKLPKAPTPPAIPMIQMPVEVAEIILGMCDLTLRNVGIQKLDQTVHVVNMMANHIEQHKKR